MMKRSASRLSRGLIAATLAILLAALLRYYEVPDRAAAFPSGAIVIGVDGSYPPFAFDDDGELNGIDVALAEAIAAEIGLTARFANISFYGLYDALQAREVDLLVSALGVDYARMDDVRYTQPYFDNGLVLVTASGQQPISISALSGVELAYEYASRADSQVRKWEGAGQRIERLPYELPTHALDALRLGQADAALVNAITLRLYVKEHPGWDYLRQFVTREPYAIALLQDRQDAWKLVDGALTALKERSELARIIANWF